MTVVFGLAATVSIVAVFAICIFLLIRGVPGLEKVGLIDFLFGTQWEPEINDTFDKALEGLYGILPMIVGTLFATAGSLLVGGGLGYLAAIFLAKFCPKKIKGLLTQVVNLLAGIPSIIYGLFGITILSPFLGIFTANGAGFGIFLVSIVLGIMILPTVVSLSKNAIEAVPDAYYEGARALGASHEQAVFKVVVQAARSGILASLILGVGRAMGETMAVVMVAGNHAVFPTGLFQSFCTLTATIVKEMGYASEFKLSLLFAIGCVLMVFVLLITIAMRIATRQKKGNRDSSKGRLVPDWLRAFYAKIDRPLGKFKKGCCYGASAFTAVALIGILLFVMIKGLPNITWQFLSSNYSWGGTFTVLPSLITTGMVVLVSLIIAVPLGIATAIYLHEYTKKGNKLVKAIRVAIEVLSGVPSIVYALFGMAFFCSTLNMGTSIIAGSLTMTIMILPVIVRSTEEALIAVPDSFREGSYALGATKLRTVFKVVLPSALPGILAAVILAMGRVVSESAPLLYTMGTTPSPIPTGLSSGGTTLATLLYYFAGEGLYPEESYATAAVLMIVVLGLNLLSTFLVKKLQRRTTGA